MLAHKHTSLHSSRAHRPSSHLHTSSAASVRSRNARRATRIAAASESAPSKKELMDVCLQAGRAAAKIIEEGTKHPRQIERKTEEGRGGNDVVTATDKAAEEAITSIISAAFPTHAIQGEEGGVSGNVNSDYLWSIDPLDGTCNFSAGYGSFAASIAVLRHAVPVACCIVEFIGGPSGGGWKQRTFTAQRNGGAFLDGQALRVSGTKDLRDSLVITESYMPPIRESWSAIAEMQRDFTQMSRGVRISGSAASNMCALATGNADMYYAFNVKPWDVAAGVLLIEEAGGAISTPDACAYSIFDRAIVATNDVLHKQVLAVTEPHTEKLRATGLPLGPWCVPQGYHIKTGAQLS